MPIMLFLILILIFVILLVVITNIVIVPQSMVYVVERLGSYSENGALAFTSRFRSSSGWRRKSA